MPKAPSTRGFTVSEKRALRFEQVSLYMVFLVAVIAATLSFVALSAVGADAGLGAWSPLLPLTIDGIGIACSVGIIRSVAAGETFRHRVSEWVGLLASIALSIRGNIEHALTVGSPALPDDIKITYAAAVPIIVAYGIHVYGRAMQKGVSAHVLADNPDELVFDLRHLGEETQAARQAPVRVARAAPAASRAQPPAQPSARPAPVARTARTARAAASDDEKARARVMFDQMLTDHPDAKPVAKTIHAELGLSVSESQARRWVQSWWDEAQEQMGMARPAPMMAPAPADEGVRRTA